MRKLLAISFAALSALLILGGVGCASHGNLEGTSWRLVEYGAQTSPVPVLSGTAITLHFNADATRATGNGGCNDYSADCVIESDSLSITNLGSTKMNRNDPPGIMVQENTYFNLLKSAERFELSGDSLTIYCAGGQKLVFTRVQYAALAGTSWVLVSYGDPTHPTAALPQVKVTLSFNADTTEISGNGGVNGYGGDAKRTDNQLTLSGIIHTEMASLDQAVNEQESAYFGLLSAARSVEFGDGTLTIHCQGGQVLLFAAAS